MPLAKPKEVLRMEKLKARGATVVYKKPLWFQQMEEEEDRHVAEGHQSDDEFQYPVISQRN